MQRAIIREQAELVGTNARSIEVRPELGSVMMQHKTVALVSSCDA